MIVLGKTRQFYASRAPCHDRPTDGSPRASARVLRGTRGGRPRAADGSAQQAAYGPGTRGIKEIHTDALLTVPVNMRMTRVVRRLMRTLQHLPARARQCVVYGLCAFVCWADVGLTRPSVQMTGYHLVPILLAAWMCGRRTTAVVTMLAIAASLYVTHGALPGDAPAWEAGIAYASTCIVLTGFALLAVGMRSAFLRLETERNTDALTGVRSRRSFLEIADYELAASGRRGTVVSLASIDLDDFKRVNDTLGHAAGDRLLIEVGDCLRQAFRRTDCIGRLGGDEFAVLLPGASEAEAAAVLEKAGNCLQRTFERFGGVAGASVGLMSTPVGGSMTLEELLAGADERMYATKRQAKKR